MAKGKRVSNKPGGDPGKRSSKTGERHYANVVSRRDSAARARAELARPYDVRKTGRTRIPSPSRSSILGRLVAPIKRFFRSK